MLGVREVSAPQVSQWAPVLECKIQPRDTRETCALETEWIVRQKQVMADANQMSDGLVSY